LDKDNPDLPVVDARTRGAYGFRLAGVAAQELLVEAPPHWPSLELRVRISPDQGPAREYVDDAIAILRPRSGGWIELDRHAGRATFCLRQRPPDAALVHPHLASVAVVSAYWLDRESFHAGGFTFNGRVWGVLGGRNAGKSSFLAQLALSGIPILCDDVLILEGTTALAGPRSVDLRASAASHLGVGDPLGVVGTRERWRLNLPPVDAEVPLAGWVSLAWSEEPEVRRPRGGDRLRTLASHRGSTLYPSSPAALIDLSGLPFVQLRRPRSWNRSADSMQLLLEALA
jgi:hypothetical protein